MSVKNNNLYIDFIEEIVEDLGFKLVYYNLLVGKGSVSCVMDIHKPLGYVSHDDCTLVSRKCYDFLSGKFGDIVSMEVSSPGVNRMLTTEREFRAFMGYNVELYFKSNFLKNYTYEDVNGDSVSLNSGDMFKLEDFADNCLHVRKVFTRNDIGLHDDDVELEIGKILLKLNVNDISKIKLLN